MVKQTKTGNVVFGIHAITELLKAKKRKLIALYTTKPLPKEWRHIERVMPSYAIPIQYVQRDQLHTMAGTTDHQGVVAYAQPFSFYGKPFNPQKYPFLVLLDSIHDPRNMGAIIRSAYCTGVAGIILCKKNSAPLTGAALKASAGLAEHMTIRLVPSVYAALDELKSAGYTMYVSLLTGEDIRKAAFKPPLCIVIGNEATGVTKELRSAGVHVTIPQISPNISYNASVAAGILLFFAGSKNQMI
jgi:23S rRNA (guanosine2251-2'-O)-methyltransferase